MSLSRRGRGFGNGARGGGSSGNVSHRTTSAPWSRLKPVQVDPLEAMGLPSKGDNRLLDRKAQESYFNLIVSRYMSFCAASGSGSALSEQFASLSLSTTTPASASGVSTPLSSSLPSPTATPPSPSTSKNTELQLLLSALRKLREALIASSSSLHTRHPSSSSTTTTLNPLSFHQTVYIFSIRFSILLSHHESYYPALTHLLYTLHPLLPLSQPHLQEFASYLVLDLACRRCDLAGAYRARCLFGVRERRVNEVLRCVTHGDYLGFWKVRRAVDGYQVKLLEWGVEHMQGTALKCLGRAYLGGDKVWVERMCGGMEWEVLKEKWGVGWELQHGEGKGEGWVVMRRPKTK